MKYTNFLKKKNDTSNVTNGTGIFILYYNLK